MERRNRYVPLSNGCEVGVLCPCPTYLSSSDPVIITAVGVDGLRQAVAVSPLPERGDAYSLDLRRIDGREIDVEESVDRKISLFE